MLRQLLASWMILAILSLSATSCGTRSPDRTPEPGAQPGAQPGAEPGAAAGESATNDGGVTPGVAKEGNGGVAASSSPKKGDSGAAKAGSGAAAELEDGWELLAVQKVTIHAHGNLWHIQVSTSTPTAGWTVELRQRKPAGAASQSAYSSEYLLVGKKPEGPAAAAVTSMKADTQVTLGESVSTVIVTGQNADGEQSVIEEVPRISSS